MVKKFTALLITAVILLLAGCGKPELVFLYDSHLKASSAIDVPVFAGSYEGSLLKTFEKSAASHGYRLKGICLEKEKEYAAAVREYSSSSAPVIMTAYIFTEPEVMKLKPENCIVVGPAADIPDGTLTAGKGLDAVTELGRELRDGNRRVSFVRHEGNLGHRMHEAFMLGYGKEKKTELFQASDTARVSVILEQGNSEAVFTAGKFLAHINTVRKGADRMILLNSPVNPILFSDKEKERIKEVFCYDFRAAFDTALENASSGTAGKNIYCLELSRLSVPMP